MTKNIGPISVLGLLIAAFLVQTFQSKADGKFTYPRNIVPCNAVPVIDTLPPVDIMDVVTVVIASTNTFNINAVADLYTPNAVIADDEPPYSWNGPTAGIQWVNAVEKACKDNRITKLKSAIGPVNVYQESADNAYIVVPVSYSGNLPGKQRFAVKGAFTFVLRLVNGKWMIKSQVWMQQKAITGQD